MSQDIPMKIQCPTCEGYGIVDKKRCETCEGRQYITEAELKALRPELEDSDEKS